MTRPTGSPSARPAAAGSSVVVALLLIGLGVVAVRDLFADRGWSGGTPWVDDVSRAVDGLRAGPLVVATGFALVVLGLLALVLAVKPARRTHDVTPGSVDLWVTSEVVAAVAASAAQDTPGVASATARSRRGRLVVVVTSHRDDVASLAPDVETGVRGALQELTEVPVVVRTKKVSHDA